MRQTPRSGGEIARRSSLFTESGGFGHTKDNEPAPARLRPGPTVAMQNGMATSHRLIVSLLRSAPGGFAFGPYAEVARFHRGVGLEEALGRQPALQELADRRRATRHAGGK